MYILNTTFAIKLAWKVIESFMAVHMKSKMMMTDKSSDPDLIDAFHPSQLEVKYGGKAPNVTEFWPPTMPSSEYGCDEDLLVSEKKYKAILKGNPSLKPRPD
mmetsp:Transcript_13665/g.15857  ORF Transcript_13665/g.15857 Transcript_13665/m.15857 type:complete len:102 (+) Transcript_13665:499-804(+)